jgi:hypothetical protein
MASQSQELIFSIIKNTSKFNVTTPKVQYGGARFSLEKGNLRNENSFRFSVLARDETVGVSINKQGQFVISHKNGANKHKPKEMFTHQIVKKRGFNKRGTTFIKSVGARPDLKSAGTTKAARLHNGQIKNKKSTSVVKK